MLELPPIPEEVVHLVTIDSPVSSEFDKRLQQTKTDFVELQKLCDFYRQKCDTSSFESGEKDAKHENHALAYANAKLVKLIRRHLGLSRDVYTKVYSTLTLTSFFMECAISLKFPVTVNFDGIKPLVVSWFKENKKFQELSMKVQALQAYIQAKGEEKVVKPTAEDCISVLEKPENVNVGMGFSYAGMFEKVFVEYLCASCAMERIDDIARAMSVHVPASEVKDPDPPCRFKITPIRDCPPFVVHKAPRPVPKGFEKWPNLVPLERFYYEMMETMKVRTLEQECILRCALIRIVFDRLYAIDRTLDTSNEEMQEGLAIVRQLRVSDMQVSLPLFDDCTIEIGNLCVENQLAREVSSFIESVSFVTNPYDLAETIYTVSRTIGSMRRTSDPNAEMCFDDFFAIFVVLFSASPPVNSCGIAKLFDVYSSICIPETLKHASTSFCAWVSYVKTFLTDDHPDDIRARINEIKQRNTQCL